ncbi:MAG: DUF5522 domain-containing protein [Myxococcota bacterium]|nr:DUF5522 domain-containing protein [Myxococcota bacterium]
MTTPPFDELHTAACEKAQRWYLDPISGYRVFTAIALEKNGSCCGCACRHCPYGHESVPKTARQHLVTDPFYVHVPDTEYTATDVLFWSGGKDGFLALRRLEKEAARSITLLTTYDGRSGRVAHQDVHIEQVRKQAKKLQTPHMLVPLFPGQDYVKRVHLGLRQLQRIRPIQRLAFGDLHLEHIRQWRFDNLAASPKLRNLELCFPVWKAPYSQLMEELFSEHAEYVVTAITTDACAQALSVGDRLTPERMMSLPPDVDTFGVNGEFHTLVKLLD